MDRTFADCLRVGHGYDVHALAPGLRLRLCGVDLEHDRGCVAHSDGDVAVHALCDALLGAAALGDIGLHFPDTAAGVCRDRQHGAAGTVYGTAGR